ncbi:hypothetical protein ACX6XY_03195 [Streptomyces sp. O3]
MSARQVSAEDFVLRPAAPSARRDGGAVGRRRSAYWPLLIT